MTSSGAPRRACSALKTEAAQFTSRDALIEDQRAHPPYGTAFGDSLATYVLVSTTRTGLRWLDSPESLEAKTRRWRAALTDVAAGDRVAWALAEQPPLNALVIPVRPLAHKQRLLALIDHRATVLVCTPTDALRLAEVAAAQHVDLVDSAVRLVVVTGEPGGSVASTRRRIEERFGARCLDVYALTETGVIGWQCPALDRGLHLDENDFAFEVLEDELILTSLMGLPLVRYRTGDLVRQAEARCACGREVVHVHGRKRDVQNVRGVDILPATIENIVRRHPAVSEYRLDTYHVRGECELAIAVEPDEAVATEGDRARVAAEVAEDVKRSLGLRLQCEAVPPASLPRDDPRPRRVVRRS